MEIINVVISFVEILSIFLIYSILFENNLYKRIGLYSLLSLMTSILYYILVKYYLMDQVIALIGGVFINAIIIGKVEKKDTIVTLIELIMSMLIVLVFELIALFLIHVIVGEYDVNSVIYCLLLTIIMFLLIVLLSKISVNKNFMPKEFISNYKGLNIIILNLFVFFLFIKVLLANNLVTTSIVVQVTMLCLILIGVNCYFYVYLYKTLNEKKKTEIQRSFNPLINELMAKVKANEHEYNNHLNTIWGIVQVSEPEDVKGKIKQYIGEITIENEQFSKLLHIDNTIIKAVLYNKIQRAEKLGVNCQYSVKSDLKSIPVDDSELTVIFSNLLNNAIEATSMIKSKDVIVNIEEDEKKYYIIVKNKVENFDMSNISKLFKIGYSTKGEGRGYGLYNVKKIVDKYKGKITIEINEDILMIIVLFDK